MTRGGYVHSRTRRQVLADLLELGVPPEVAHLPELMTVNQKPSAYSYKRAEALLVRVREAIDAGKDPAPLWAQWLPAKRRGT